MGKQKKSEIIPPEILKYLENEVLKKFPKKHSESANVRAIARALKATDTENRSIEKWIDIVNRFQTENNSRHPGASEKTMSVIANFLAFKTWGEFLAAKFPKYLTPVILENGNTNIEEVETFSYETEDLSNDAEENFVDNNLKREEEKIEKAPLINTPILEKKSKNFLLPLVLISLIVVGIFYLLISQKIESDPKYIVANDTSQKPLQVEGKISLTNQTSSNENNAISSKSRAAENSISNEGNNGNAEGNNQKEEKSNEGLSAAAVNNSNDLENDGKQKSINGELKPYLKIKSMENIGVYIFDNSGNFNKIIAESLVGSFNNVGKISDHVNFLGTMHIVYSF